MSCTPTIHRTRNRDSLAEKPVQCRRSYVYSTSSFVTGSKALKERTEDHENFLKSAADTNFKYCHEKKNELPEICELQPLVISRDFDGIQTLQKHTLHYFYKLFGSPEIQYCSSTFIRNIMRAMKIPINSYRSVRTTICQIAYCSHVSVPYCPVICRSTQGKKRIIADGSLDGKKILSLALANVKVTPMTKILNEYRRLRLLPPISRSTVQSYLQKTDLAEQYKIEEVKMGNIDPLSKWSIARLNFFCQLKSQFELGDVLGAFPELDLKEFSEDDILPLYLQGIVFWDCKHKKCIFGSIGKMRIRLRVNEFGVPTKKEDGGVFAKKLDRPVPKFSQEARFLLGAAVGTDLNGEYYGMKPAVLDYSMKEICTEKKIRQQIAVELHNKKQIGNIPTKARQKQSVWFGGYKKRYPEDWYVRVRAVVEKNYLPINAYIDHIWAESKAVYFGTIYEKCFSIYHDHLTLFWAKETVDYMKKIGMWRHVIKIHASASTTVSSYYIESVPGNSPENARALDSYGIADLEAAIPNMVALTSRLENDDPLKFSVGTPKLTASTLKRCWEVSPTSERVVQDIMDWRRVIDLGIGYNGCIIPGEGFRRGHRSPRSDKKGLCESKYRNRQRVETLEGMTVHPDALDEYKKWITDEETFGQIKSFIDIEDQEILGNYF